MDDMLSNTVGDAVGNAVGDAIENADTATLLAVGAVALLAGIGVAIAGLSKKENFSFSVSWGNNKEE